MLGKMVGVRWMTLNVLLLTAVFSTAGATIGAISIDFGSQFLKVGIVKPGVPMEIVLNKESHRKTPNVVSIRNDERLFGDAAQAVNVRYPASVYCHLLDLIAKHTDHPSVLLFRQRFPQLKLEKHVNESSVVFPIGGTNYPVETLLAMILTNVREFTENFAEMKIHDVVISVPEYFTQAERLIVEKATEIAGMNLLQLINGGTAAGLNYGMFRRKEITEKPQRLLIYDMGASKTVATLVEYKTSKTKNGNDPKMTVLGVGFDRWLGGLEMTMRLRNLLVEKFKQNYKTKKDITTSERAMAKLLKEAERLKQVLSANNDYFAQVESVHEDIDMRVQVTREEFNKLIDDLMPRVSRPIEEALAMAELKLDEVDQVVLMGAATRVPRVQEEVQKFIGSKELGRFLNTDEAIAMGALFQAAHLSKGFKVKPFGVEDLVIFPVQVSFVSKQKQDNGDVIEKPITRQIVNYKGKYPTRKKTITFTSYTDDFSFDLNYSDLQHFKEDQIKELDSLVPHVTTVSVSGVGKALEEKLKPDETEFVGVKVGFQIDLSGILRIEKAEAVIQRKSQGVVDFGGGGGGGEKTNSDGGYFSTITKTISGFFSKKTEEGEPTDTEERKDEEPAEVPNEEKPEAAEEKPSASAEKPSDEGEMKPDENAEISNENSTEPTKEETSESVEKKDDAKESPKTENASLPEKADGTASEAAKEKSKTPEVIRVALKTMQKYTNAHMMSKEDVKNAKRILEQFEKRERNARERAAAENELEAYAFDVSQLNDDEEFVKHSKEDERNKLRDEAKRIRTWLEDEAGPQTETVEFTRNLLALKALVRPVKVRIEEEKTLAPALKNLEMLLNSSRVMAGMGGDDEKAMFNKSDADAFSQKLDKLSTWLDQKKVELEKHLSHEDPIVMTSEVVAKLKVLDRELNVFMKKMKQTRIKDVEEMLKKDSEQKADPSKESTKEVDPEKDSEQKPVKDSEQEADLNKASEQETGSEAKAEGVKEVTGDTTDLKQEGDTATKEAVTLAEAGNATDQDTAKIEL